MEKINGLYIDHAITNQIVQVKILIIQFIPGCELKAQLQVHGYLCSVEMYLNTSMFDIQCQSNSQINTVMLLYTLKYKYEILMLFCNKLRVCTYA